MTDLALSRRAMAAGFEPGPGCLMLVDLRHTSPARYRINELGGWNSKTGAFFAEGPPPEWIIGPDLTDDATLGCLTGQVRRAWAPLVLGCHEPALDDDGRPEAMVMLECSDGCDCDAETFYAPTLAEALVRALEAHHAH